MQMGVVGTMRSAFAIVLVKPVVKGRETLFEWSAWSALNPVADFY